MASDARSTRGRRGGSPASPSPAGAEAVGRQGNGDARRKWFGMAVPAAPSDMFEAWQGLMEAPAGWVAPIAATKALQAGGEAVPGVDAWRQMMRSATTWPTAAAEAATAGQHRLWPDGGWLADATAYWVDSVQRQILFWDVMRKRGNQALEHLREGKPPVLLFDYELIMDGAEMERPTNYMLLRILPERGIAVDPKKRPFVVVDPRAGHGPGIGGSKEASQVGVAMRAGHPVYFVGFRPEPVPGQTIEDVGWAEAQFLLEITRRHPEAEGKPVVVGNCQAGWAIMMLAATMPELTGVIGIAGSPLSYWAGVEGRNPMRYTGGLLGGSWLASLAGDLGNGKFDGAHLVQNFENLNPANTLWTKQYNLYSKIDTEEPRYLGFEKWWTGLFFTTKEEMRFITDELFVGNKLTKGTILTRDRRRIDLENIRSPIVVIASWGDDITPPPQALYWIHDLYESVDEIIANEQTIIYTLDQRIGHLGIFVSAKVAEKQHAEIVATLDLIEVLPPGLYEMVLEDKPADLVGGDLLPGQYLVRFEERSIDDILALGDGREHEKPFETAAEVSEINEGLYDAFVSPWVRFWNNDVIAEALRMAHPLRAQRFWLSDLNPAMRAVQVMADMVGKDRRPAPEGNPLVKSEHAVSDQIIAALDGYRQVRDQMAELTFKTIYNSPWVEAWTGLRAPYADERKPRARDTQLEESLARKKAAIRSREPEGGFDEAVMRILLACAKAHKMVDARGLRLGRKIIDEYPEFERVGPQAFKELVKEEAFMIRFDEEHALATLPALLPSEPERRRALELVRRIGAARGDIGELSEEVLEKVERILGIAPVAGEPVPDGPTDRPGEPADRSAEIEQAAGPSRPAKKTPTRRARPRSGAGRAR